MFAHERHTAILALLEKHRRLEVQELLGMVAVSPATLRRDLAYLESADLLVRVHGGVLHPSEVAGEPSFWQKSTVSIEAKKLIAANAVKTIPSGATVFVDSGTTCLEAGRLLRCRPDVTIITNSLPLIASHEQFRAKLLVLGGELRAVSGALVGDLALSAIGRLRADVSLIGASGLHPTEGAGTPELLETAIKQQWLSRSARQLLLADASKWHQSMAIQFAQWSDFTEFYTDQAPPKEFRKGSLKIFVS